MNPTDSDDPTHLATRSALGPVLEAHGVLRVETDATTRTWTFADEVPMEAVRALARALGIAIRGVDAPGERADRMSDKA